METPYIALIHKQPDSCYGVHFPDFPGVIDAADTLEEARAKASDLLELAISLWRGDGMESPAPSTLDAIMADPDNRDGVAYLVTAKTGRSRAVRINITMEEDLLRAVDKAARAAGLKRSGFLAQAARHELAAQDE